MAAYWTLPREVEFGIKRMAAVLHEAVSWRLVPLMVGLLFAKGRKTIASWLRGGGLSKDFQDYYYFLGSLGRKIKSVATMLLDLAVRQVPLPERLVFALDDTPTKRFGPKVQGAGIHHNPTPGPTEQKFLYGHVWVTVSWVVRHPWWGAIGLPLLALLYIRQKDVPTLPKTAGWKFQTKLELAGALVAWLAENLKKLGKTLWVVVDGAYAKKVLLAAARKASAIVVSRLRRDAALYDVPKPRKPGQRGRPRKYGAKRISLAKRAGHRQGWQTGTFTLYGETVTKKYKTFVATWRPAEGLIRVVLVKEGKDWVAWFCTQTEATVAQILETVADRSAIEQNFHDVKEVHGAGQPQLRYVWANVAAFNLTLWWHTLIELWAWAKPKQTICDRSASPWDDAARRPSHADRRKALQRECLETEFRNHQPKTPLPRKIKTLFDRLKNLAA
jgi:hypothetical protein